MKTKGARTDKKAAKYGSAVGSPAKDNAAAVQETKPRSGAFYAQNPERVGIVAEAAALLEERPGRMDSIGSMGQWMKQSAVRKATPTRLSFEAEENRLARQLISEVSQDNADVNSLCGAYKLKREELGRLTGFSLRALAEWAGGKLPSQPAKRRLHEVRRLLDALAEIVKVESIPQWLHQPNPGFERLTPLQVIEVGEIDRLWAMVHDLGSGQPA